ncbi:MAG: glycosyl hydrolase family 65 protein [Acidimicrobiales bacterium]
MRPEPSAEGSLPGGLGDALPFDPAWCLVAEPGEAAAPAAEGEFCLADGTIGTRAVREEEADPDIPAVLVTGLFEPAPVVGERLMTVPSWLALPLAQGIPLGRRMLDLRGGVLTREVDDGDTVLHSVRFACHDRPGTAVLVADVNRSLVAADPAADPGEEVTVRRGSPFGGGVAMAISTTVRPSAGGPGELVTVERLASYVASSDRLPKTGAAVNGLRESEGFGAARLLGRERAYWAERWDVADVEVLGDVGATRSLRAALFQLTSAGRRRGEVAIGARGLTGPGYAGHVFWDTEAFVLPVLAAVDAPAARAALEYRIRRLEPARRRAASEGRSGARFPWESAHSGEDVTPQSGVDPRGRTVAIATGEREVHITAIVAWAAWRYATWHGGWAFLEGPGRPLLVDTARYWSTRIRTDAQGRGHIDEVIGPDEYHENVDDDAFTNLMARWNLCRAAELVDRTGGDVEEAADWRRAAYSLVDNYRPETGVYQQFTGFDDLEPVLANAEGTTQELVEATLSHLDLDKTQVIKQADVLMAHFLVPDGVAEGSLDPNLDYYLPRTVHGSSLSPAVHATLLARAGRPDEALALFRMAMSVDFDALHDNTVSGLHLANLGGMWQAVAHGFAGLSASGPGDRYLSIAPSLPADWGELRIRVSWRGRRLRLTCRHDAVHVGCDSPVTVVVNGTPVRVRPPGRWVG